VVSKVALAYTQPFTFAAIYVSLSALCLFLLLALTRRPLGPPAPAYTVAIGLLQTTGFVGLAVWALELTDAGRVAVLIYTMPFWLLLLAWPVLGERLRGVQWLAAALAFTGLVLVVAPWELAGVLSSLLAVAAGLAWAASALVIKLLQRREAVDGLRLATWQMLFGVVPLAAVAVLTRTEATQWAVGFVASLTYTVVLGNAVAWLLWLYALRALSAGAAGLGTLAVPVLGVLAAWLQLGEVPDAAEAAGMALIVGALAILTAYGVTAGRRAA
jgi:drug/metabolite transporter (DMT)-like permease